jgi:tetratricopeptide (TPR) repeat protein
VSPAFAAILSRLTLGAVNLTAAVILLAMPFAVAVVAQRSRRGAALVAVLGLFVIVASGSRGGLSGLAVALAAAIVLLIVAFGSDQPRRQALRQRLGGHGRTVGVTAVIAGATLAGVLGPAIFRRFASGVDEARQSLYGATVSMIEKSPVFGSGPGTWSVQHSAFTPEGARNIVQHHAHDTYLQTLSDLGIVGAIACVGVVAVVAYRLFLRFRTSEGTERLMIGAILVGLTGAAGHAVSDHFLNLPVYCLILAALVAIGLESPRPHVDTRPDADAERDLRRNRRGGAFSRATALSGVAVLAVVIAGFLISAPTIVQHTNAELLAADATAAANSGNWARAATLAGQASKLDPELPLYRIELGVALAHLRDPAARGVLTQAAAEDPLPHLQLSAAALALADGDASAALSAVELAEARTARESVVDLNSGEVARLAGRPDLAVEWWSRAFNEDTALAGSGFFRDASRSGLAAQAVLGADALMAEDGNDVGRAVLAAYAGSPAKAETALTALPPSTARDVALARVYWIAGRREDAIATAQAAAKADPSAPAPANDVVAYCTEIGDEACVTRYTAWAILVPDGADASTPNDGSTIPAPDDQRSRGVPEAYATSVYLQQGFDDMLAPEVLVVGLP